MKIERRLLVVAVSVSAHLLSGQTRLDLRTQIKSPDLSSLDGTKPAQTGSVLPASCSIGQQFLLVNSAGANLTLCTSPNVWVPIGGSAGGPPVTLKIDGTVWGKGTSFDMLSSGGSAVTVAANGSDLDVTVSPDSSVFTTRTDVQAGSDSNCVPSSGSSTTYTCSLPHPLAAYAEGMRILWAPDFSCAGGVPLTLNIDGNGARRILQNSGKADPLATQCPAGSQVLLVYSGSLNSNTGGWRILSSSGEGTSPAAVHAIAYPFNGAGVALSAGKVVYLPDVPFSCSISGWSMAVDQGTAAVDIWVTGDGTTLPAITDSITGSATPAITTGTRIRSTAVQGWKTLLPAHSSLAFYLASVSGATQATISVECDQ